MYRGMYLEYRTEGIREYRAWNTRTITIKSEAKLEITCAT